MSEKPSGDRAARRHETECRRTATLEGHHLPTTIELLCGFPFFRADLEADVEAWVEQTAPGWVGRDDEVAVDLYELRVVPTLATFEATALRLRDKVVGLHGDDAARTIDRLLVYAAALCSADALVHVARLAAALAQNPDMPKEDRSDLVGARPACSGSPPNARTTSTSRRWATSTSGAAWPRPPH